MIRCGQQHEVRLAEHHRVLERLVLASVIDSATDGHALLGGGDLDR
jgi:hypothetical protein